MRGIFPVKGVDVYAILHVGNNPRRHGGGLLEKILPAGLQGLFSHPHQHGFKVRGDEGDIVGVNQHISATDVDLVFKRQGHGQRRHGLLHFSLKGMDGFYPACFARREHHDLIARPHDARGHRSAKTAKVQVGTIDVLDRKPKVDQIGIRGNIDLLQEVHQRAARIPRHMRACVHHVIAAQRRHG